MDQHLGAFNVIFADQKSNSIDQQIKSKIPNQRILDQLTLDTQIKKYIKRSTKSMAITTKKQIKSQTDKN